MARGQWHGGSIRRGSASVSQSFVARPTEQMISQTQTNAEICIQSRVPQPQRGEQMALQNTPNTGEKLYFQVFQC